VLRPIQDVFSAGEYPDLLIGLSSPDDAAVWRLNDSQALVVTTDFFTPVVDDPYDYGAVAAANALSDVYAMGGRPILALNVAAMPPSLPAEIVAEIFRGGAEMVRQAGAVVAGGHTVQDKEPKFGLVAVGLADPRRLMSKAQARPGDRLILTKPLGTGVTTTALKSQQAEAEHVRVVVAWMKQLNRQACELALSHQVRAATDVTGFSLLGHACEMARHSGVGMRLFLGSIPFLPFVRRYAERGFFPGGSADNRLYYEAQIDFDAAIDDYDRMLLFDAQTSGGLLLCVPAETLPALILAAEAQGQPVWPIGEVALGERITVEAGSYAEGRPAWVDQKWPMAFHPGNFEQTAP
jgi:selenide, water dikinase